MKTVSKKTFETKVKEGWWEVMFEVNSFGWAEVRSNVTGKRFLVTVVENRKGAK